MWNGTSQVWQSKKVSNDRNVGVYAEQKGTPAGTLDGAVVPLCSLKFFRPRREGHGIGLPLDRYFPIITQHHVYIITL